MTIGKAMTTAERIDSVDPDIRQELIEKNQSGVGMKHLATAYGISEGTVRVIIRNSKLTDLPVTTKRANASVRPDLWNRPDLWEDYGLKGPAAYRMV